MGRVFLTYLDESNPGEEYYQCRGCKAHIALLSDLRCTYWPGLSGKTGGIFKKIVNGHIDETEEPVYLAPPEVLDLHELFEINCIQCMDLLGWKYVELSDVAEEFIHEGDVEIIMEKLEKPENGTEDAEQQQQASGNAEDAEMAEQGEQQAEQGEQQGDAEMRDSEDSNSDQDIL